MYSKKIIEKVIAMDETQLSVFLSKLSPDSLDYLEIILDKTEKELEKD